MLTAPLAVVVFYLATQPPVSPIDSATAAANRAAPAPPSEGAVHILKDGHAHFELLDTDGVRHKASLVQIDGDTVVLKAGKDVFRIPVDQLQRSSRRGDSSWDGAVVGLSVGLGLCTLVAQDDPAAAYRWTSSNPDDWTLKDSVSLVAFSTTVGYIVDALHVGRHTVFVGPMRASAAKPKGGLTLNVAGLSRERQLQIGYRMIF